MSNKAKPIYLIVFMMLSIRLGYSQVGILSLSQPVTGNQDHVASEEVRFLPGYSYAAVGTNCMRGRVSFSNNLNPNIPCGHLSKSPNGGAYKVQDGIVYIKYREEYNTNNFRFNIYDNSSNLVATQADIPIINFNGYGDNRIEIPVNNAQINLSPGFYLLEVINDKEEKWYLRFEY